MKEKIARLKQITNNEKGIRAIVAQHALDEENPIAYLHDVTTHGCASGMVGPLIYYVDTHKFFDGHYEEIEALREELEENMGAPIYIKGDLKNFFAWFAYEEMAYQILSELE